MWYDYPLAALVIVPILSLLLLYLVRSYCHGLIRSLAALFHAQLRLLSRFCYRLAAVIAQRNRDLTAALAEALMERQLERRFMRIEKLVERDLANYQQLFTQINQRLATMDEDYEASAIVPGASPDWVAAVDAIAALKGDERNSEVMVKILADMHSTIQKHHQQVLSEHRWTVSSRHKLLFGLRPQWRKLSKLLEQIEHNIDVLRQRLGQVDQHMAQFELLTADSGKGVMYSMVMRFCAALCFVLVGVGVAWVNVQLLQLPLADVLTADRVGGIGLVLAVSVLHIAITLVAAAMVTESLRITHLFPLIEAMTKRGRNVMLYVGVGLLLALLAIELVALLGQPINTEAAPLALGEQWILALLGVVLPVMLALLVIPLEHMLHTVRPVLGGVILLLLQSQAMALRLLANLVVNLGKFIVHCYDLVIFIPLQLERIWLARQMRKAVAANTAPLALLAADETANVSALRVGAKEGQ